MAVINKTIIIPPGRKVIRPIPLIMYRVIKAVREIKNILNNIGDVAECIIVKQYFTYSSANNNLLKAKS